MSGEIRTQHSELFVLDTTIKKILNVDDLGEFGGSADDIEVTNLDSTAKEFLTGLVDNGELPLQINVNPADLVHQALQGWAGDGVLRKFMVCLSENGTDPTVTSGNIVPVTGRTCFAFSATVKSFKFGLKKNDAFRATCTLRLSGAVTPTWA